MKRAFHGGAFFNAVGPTFQSLERSKDVIPADVLDAWFDPSPKILDKLKEHLPFSLKTSPPVHAGGLIETIASVRGVSKEGVLVGGGSSDLVFATLPNLPLKNKKVVILDPMYGEYRYIFEKVVDEIDITKFLLEAETNFELPVDKFIKFIQTQNPGLVVIVNPNSPTGTFLKRSNIEKILSDIPQDTFFAVDEAYINYVSTTESAEPLVEKFDNLMVIKSLSKVYALSGVRVGYVVAGKKIINHVAKFIPPWSVSLPGQIAAVEALQDTAYYTQKWDETRDLREKLSSGLLGLPNVKVYPSQANYLLVELLNNNRGRADEIIQKLTENKVFLRNPDSMGEMFQGRFIRITVRSDRENQVILTQLTNHLH